MRTLDHPLQTDTRVTPVLDDDAADAYESRFLPMTKVDVACKSRVAGGGWTLPGERIVVERYDPARAYVDHWYSQ